MQQKLLELDIQKLQFVIENNEKKIAEQLEKVKNKQIGKVSQQAKPKIVEIKEQEKKLKKKLSGLNEELGKRRALEDVLMKNIEIHSISQAEVERVETPKILNILTNLTTWDSMPEIVRNQLMKQEDILHEKKAQLALLEEKLESRRKKYFAAFTKQIRLDRGLWEDECRDTIDQTLVNLKSKHEKQINDLKFQKRLLEISLFKTQKN